MDVNDYVFGNGVISPEQQRAIAGSLRSRDNMGTIMALTGDKAAAPVGGQFMQSANAGRQQGLTHNYYQGMLRQSAADLAERKRNNDLNYRANMARTAQMDQQGGEKRMTDGLRKDLVESMEIFRSMKRTQQSFNPEFTSAIPGVGPMRRTLGRLAPGIAKKIDPLSLEYKDWFSDLDRTVEAALRHKLFGSALTATEVKKWRELTIDPNASPEQVIAWYERNMPIIEREVNAYAQFAMYNYPEQTQILMKEMMGQEEQEAQPQEQQQEELLYTIED